jgi:hypothetical protein
MKTKTVVVIAILVFTLFVGMECFAVRKKPISSEEAISKISGIWVNTEYPDEVFRYPQKLSITSDGRIEWFMDATMINPTKRATYMIAESWIDSRGHIYCAINAKHYSGAKTQELWKLDKSGKKLEINMKETSGEEFPTKIDRDTDLMANPITYYMVYYRQ